MLLCGIEFLIFLHYMTALLHDQLCAEASAQLSHAWLMAQQTGYTDLLLLLMQALQNKGMVST